MLEILVKCPLFVGMKNVEIDKLLKSVNHQLKKFNQGELIAQSGEEITSLYIIVDGSVKGEMNDFSGKTIKIEDIESPRPLAPAFLFGKMNHFPVNIIANENVKILYIPKNSFVRMMQSNEKVLGNFLGIISNKAQFLSGKIKFLSFQTIKGKLANYLLQESIKTNSEKIILNKSQSQLADLFGVARPSLGRAIREMDREGIIWAHAKEVMILDKHKLSALLK